MDNKYYTYMALLIVIVCALAFWTKPVNAANEYLQNGGSHCSTATLEPYAEIGQQEGTSGNTYPNSNNNNYNGTNDGSSVRFGFRLNIPLGSTCTKKYKRTMLQNELLKQQLELLKMCARYKDLVLGPEFAEVKRMCAGVQKKPEPLKIKVDEK